MVQAVLIEDKNVESASSSRIGGAGGVVQQSSGLNRSEQGRQVVGTKADFQFREPHIANAKAFLTSHHWPEGLQKALIKSLMVLPLRYFICDDSGSMLTNDGHKVIGTGDKTKVIGCTRWSELVHSLEFHAELAEAAMAPSEFRLINIAKPVMLGMGNGDRTAIEELYEVFEAGPKGQTPICEHIRAVIADIKSMEKKLRDNKQQVAVIISTDGEATDGDIAKAMEPLQDLPVWVVIKLCTDEDKIVQYWNGIDEELELEIDVLDDFCAEGEEVNAVNSWMTYGEATHKLREFGAIIKEFDLLDESTLSSEQMRTVVSILIGNGNVRSIPHPDEDWKVFLEAVQTLQSTTAPVYDPLRKALMPWVNIPNLCKVYGKPNHLQSAACVMS
jgi:hypothetical protein